MIITYLKEIDNSINKTWETIKQRTERVLVNVVANNKMLQEAAESRFKEEVKEKKKVLWETVISTKPTVWQQFVQDLKDNFKQNGN